MIFHADSVGDVASINSSGVFTATNSFRAPIFYDNNNTAYYGDFASTSNLNALTMAGAITTPVGTSIYIGNQNVSTTSRLIINWHTDTDYNYLIGKRAGAWTQPMDIAFYTGLRYHAHSSYGGHKFYTTGYDSNVALTIGDGDNNVRVIGDIRAPIYYDSDNTSYYTNPAGASVFSDIRGNGGNLQIVANNVGRNTKWRQLESSTDIGISFYNAADTWLMQLYANAGTEYGFLNGNWASWDFRKVPSGNLFLNNQSTYYINGTEIYYNRVYGVTDIRSPIFYDNDNTAYYLDAASTSSLNRISTVRTDNWLYIDNNYGHSVVGVYASTRYQGVFAMGDSYKLPADGTTTGSLYGLAWSHPNAGGAAGNLTDHGLLVINNGVFKCAISNSIVASGNITAYSDERLKTNWRDMPEDYVTRLAQVKVGIYDRIDQEDVTQVGVSAQSFQELLPQAIMTAKDEMQTLSVSYGNAALASAVELAKEVVDLRARVAMLESLISKLIDV